MSRILPGVARPGGPVSSVSGVRSRSISYKGLGRGKAKRPSGQGFTAKTGTGQSTGSSFDILIASLYVANMTDVLEAASGAAKMFLEFNKISIDNTTFKLFYRGTTTLLVLASVFASAKQMFGDPISCEIHMGRGIKDDVLNSYCWMYSTFNLPPSFRGSCARTVRSNRTRLYNTYYQWVPMFLGVCALLACVPRLIWLMCEGGLMSFLTKGTGSKLVEHSREKREILLDAFTKHLKNRYNCYALTFFICETLNLVVLMVLFYLTDEFLQNQFALYGPTVFTFYYLIPAEEKDLSWASNPMCEAFPRVAACDFVRYGTGGLRENQNAICVLSLNMINDKLFLVIWFWYAFLLCCILKRFMSRLIQIVWPRFRFYKLHMRIHRYIDSKTKVRHLEAYIRQAGIGDWFVLYQMSYNMNRRFYTDFLMTLIQRECPCPPEIKICEIEDNEKANAMYNTEESEELDQADGGRDRLTPLPPIQSIKDFKAKYNRKFSAVSTQSECIDLSCPADSDYDD